MSLVLTPHPFQRAGAWATAVLAGVDHPAGVGALALQQVVTAIVDDAVEAAIAPKGGLGYGWWKVLFNFYPNAKPTHAQRPKDTKALRSSVEAMFVKDGTDRWPCTFCGTPTSVMWDKTGLQLFDSPRYVNTTPPGVAGWPVCRPCRVAMWALPYGCSLSPGSASVLTSADAIVERAFVARCVAANRQLVTSGAASVDRPAEAPEAAVLSVVRSLDPRHGGTLWTFRNDNQAPWLRVTYLSTPAAKFVARLGFAGAAEHGWNVLAQRITVLDRQGAVTARGTDRAAKLLFVEDTPASSGVPRLLATTTGVARRRLGHDDDIHALAALARRFGSEVLGMNDDEKAKIEQVAGAVSGYIAARSSRGRFQRFRRATWSRPLAAFLQEAEAERLLTGRGGDSIPIAAADLVLGSGDRSQTARHLLFFAVVERLQGVDLGTGDDEDDINDLAALTPEEIDEEEYA